MLKTILSNTVAQLVAKAVGVILTLTTTLLIIRSGGPELFGDLTKVVSLIAIGSTAIDFGLNAVAVRSMKGAEKEQIEVLKNTLITRLALSVVVAIIINVIVQILPGGYTREVRNALGIGSLAIIFQGIFTSMNVWFQRNLEYWRMSVASVVGSIVGAAATFYVIRTSPSLSQVISAYVVGYIAMAGVSLVMSPRLLWGGNFVSPILPTLARSIPLGAILIMSVIASKVDTVILGIYRSSSEVGQYGFAYRIFDVALVLPVFVMNAVYPLLVGSKKNKKSLLVNRSLMSLVVTACIGSGVVWIAAPLINVIRPDMEISINALRILGLALPFFFATAPLMWQLIEAGLEKYILVVYGGAAVANMVGNTLLVPHYGVIASAILTGVTEASILTGLIIIKKKMYGRL